MRVFTRLTLLFICLSAFVSATPSIYLEYSIEKPTVEDLMTRETLKSDQGYDIEITTNPDHTHTWERTHLDIRAVDSHIQKGQKTNARKSAYY